MRKMHERKNVGKIVLSPMKEPEPEPEPTPPAAAAAPAAAAPEAEAAAATEAPKEGVRY